MQEDIQYRKRSPTMRESCTPITSMTLNLLCHQCMDDFR